MKRVLLEICFGINVLLCLAIVPLLLTVLLGNDSIYSFLKSESGYPLRLLNIPLLILWVNNFVIWSKKDKNMGQLALLLFFNFYYNPFYYRSAVKNKWI